MTEISNGGGGPIMVPLPDGAHALFRNPRNVPERLRRPVANARMRLVAMMPTLPAGVSKDEEVRAYGETVSKHPEMLDEVNDGLILAFVSGWSFKDENGVPLPVTQDGLQELPGVAYDELVRATTKYRDDLFPSFEPSKDPDSPTLP